MLKKCSECTKLLPFEALESPTQGHNLAIHVFRA